MTLSSALFSHYRRHPLQLLALALMILVATMLWSSVSQLTSQARDSLGQSQQVMAAYRQLIRSDSQPVTVADFVHLRRAGICVMPWLEVTPSTGTGRVIGVDPLAAACFGGSGQGPVVGTLDGKPFVDISQAAALAAEDSPGELSLLVPDGPVSRPLPPGYREASFETAPDSGELGRSFLLNLDALSLLVLLITALLVRSVYLLGQAQRAESFALLRRFGVRPLRVQILRVLELVALAMLCILPGILLGRLLAGILGNSFARAMDSLFDLPLYAGQGGNGWSPALVIMAVVALACLTDLLPKPSAVLPRGALRRLHWLAPGVLVAGLVLAPVAPSLSAAFLAVALVFVGTGLLTPRVLSTLARWQAERQKNALARWRYSELGVFARRLALPLVALQFALAMVLAVQALVAVFEVTFDQWLSRRLAAEYFVEVPPGADSRPAVHWLQGNEELVAGDDWYLLARARGRLPATETAGEGATDLLVLEPLVSMITGWDLLAQAPEAWPRLRRGKGLMVNEQLARRRGLTVGDQLFVDIAGVTLTLPVLAVYPDYGRPAAEVLVSRNSVPAGFQPSFESFAISPAPGAIDTIVTGLQQVWGQGLPQMRDNRRVRELADAVFRQTFLLTRTLALVTLILAAAALLMMGWVFLSGRVWYYRLLVVWGLSRHQALGQLARLALMLTTGVALLALPLGIWLTWVLVSCINPLAFGWSLPMAVYPGVWLQLGALSVLVGAGIAVLMAHQLRHPAVVPASASELDGGAR